MKRFCSLLFIRSRVLPFALSVLAAVPLFAEDASAAEGGRRLSLAEAVALSEQRNETLLIAREDEMRAAGVVKEARAGALPQLTLEGTYQGNFKKPAFFAPEEFGGGKFEMGSDIDVGGTLRLDQVLYAFGRVGNAIRFAGIYREMAELGVNRARGEVIFAASETYYRVLLAEQTVKIRLQSLEQARSQLAGVEEKLANGTVPEFDALRSRVEVLNRQPELISAENDLALSIQDLKRMLGIEEESDPVLTDTLSYTPFFIEEEEAVREALDNRPEILSLQLNVEGRKKILAIEKAGKMPTLNLYGQMSLQGQGDKDDLFEAYNEDHHAISSSAGIVLSIPIFDGFRTSGKTEQAWAELRRAEYELEQARKAVRLEVTQAVGELESLRRAYEAQVATVELAVKAYRIAETRYENGLSTRLELTDVEMALDAARTNFANTLYRYRTAIANLERICARSARTLRGRASSEERKR